MQTVLNKKPSCLIKGGLAFLLRKGGRYKEKPAMGLHLFTTIANWNSIVMVTFTAVWRIIKMKGSIPQLRGTNSIEFIILREK